MTAPIRTRDGFLIRPEFAGCRSCGGCGYHREPGPGYAPGQWRETPCDTCNPAAHFADHPRKSSAQLLDEATDTAWASDPDGERRDYWDRWHAGDYFNAALVIGGAVLAGAAWVAADLVFGAVVGVM